MPHECGRVLAISSGQLRLRGLGYSVSLGECLICQTQDGPVPIQVVRIDATDVRAAPFVDGYRIRRDDIVLRMPPQIGTPDEAWRGRILNGLGMPVDGQAMIATKAQQEEPAISARQRRILSACRVDEAFRTGVAAIDVFTPALLRPASRHLRRLGRRQVDAAVHARQFRRVRRRDHRPDRRENARSTGIHAGNAAGRSTRQGRDDRCDQRRDAP